MLGRIPPPVKPWWVQRDSLGKERNSGRPRGGWARRLGVKGPLLGWIKTQNHRNGAERLPAVQAGRSFTPQSS